MAFKLNVKKTMDFIIQDEEKGFNYYVKFHDTEELGKTISISEDGTEYTGYPATAFAAIIDQLRYERMLDTPKIEDDSPQKTNVSQKPSYPVPMGLPLPQVLSSSQQNPSFVSPQHQSKLAIGQVLVQTQYDLPVVFEPARTVPLESFSRSEDESPSVVALRDRRPVISEERQQEVTDDMAVSGVDMEALKHVTIPVGDTPAELKEEAKKMMMERVNALANVKTKGLKTGFRKAHKESEEE